MKDLKEKIIAAVNSDEKRVHIIHWKNKWRVKKRGKLKASISLKDRDLAISYGCAISDFVVVHNKDGTVDCIYKNKEFVKAD